MDTQGIAADSRSNLDSLTTSTPFLRAVDEQIEAAQGKLDTLFNAIGIFGELSGSLDTKTGPDFEPGHLAPVLRTFAEYGEQLMCDLRAATAIRGLPTA